MSHGSSSLVSLRSSTREGAPGAWSLFSTWVPYVLGQRTRAIIVLRWVRFAAERQATLVASLLAKRSPPTPLVWMTVEAKGLERVRPEVEDALLARLRELVPPALKAVVLADEGFSEPRTLRRLDALGLDYVVRLDPDTVVFNDVEGCRPAAAWTPGSLRPGRVRDVRLTLERIPVGALVCVKKGARETPWCLATSLRTASATTVVGIYSRLRREGPEVLTPEVFARMDLAAGGPHPPGQRDRLLLQGALVTELLTLLGAVGRGLGLSRPEPKRPARRGVRTLFQQGCIYYQALPLMPGSQAHQLVAAFHDHLDDKPAFRALLEAL
ncbi:hypothetical protein [Corallococcus terminator]|uniref:Transposase IS4-like domain-containing protein n=1 Tax=Corallococcus terminator TaxID=2316733 RepID=A0A3A8J9L0_9BACT|nr:hypothetical protein [Corallococcus terminator]RKG86203.1 hypothetical protein D7V88_18390 [Corallococcus terminator]